MELMLNRTRLARVAIVLVVVLVASQALGVATAPAGGVAPTGRVLGKTAFAFVGGLRTFAAAVIWNRLEPQFHGYYEGQSVGQMKWALPATAMVQILDPQFLQAYYVASFSVYQMGAKEEGMNIARQGVENNPKSGLMHANLAQMLMVDGVQKNLPEMVEEAGIGMRQDAYWSNDEDLYEGLTIFRTVYSLNGDERTAAGIERRLEELRSSGADLGDHDHDGDGKQDH